MAEVSSSPYGPWTIKERARASRQVTLTGLAPGSHQWVRVGTSLPVLDLGPDHGGAIRGARRDVDRGSLGRSRRFRQAVNRREVR